MASPTRGDAASALAFLSSEKKRHSAPLNAVELPDRASHGAAESNDFGIQLGNRQALLPASSGSAAVNHSLTASGRYGTRGVKPNARYASLASGADDSHDAIFTDGQEEGAGYDAENDEMVDAAAPVRKPAAKGRGRGRPSNAAVALAAQQAREQYNLAPAPQPAAALSLVPMPLPVAPIAPAPSSYALAPAGAGEGADGAAGAPIIGYCRKDKSLGLLCDNFLRFCREQRDGVISLDAASASLGTERRRLYDVTNILEALDVVSRRNKNAYTWHGTAYLGRTLKRLLDSALADAGRAGDVVPNSTMEEAQRAALGVAKPAEGASGKGKAASTALAIRTTVPLARQHWFFGKLARVVGPKDAAAARARAGESPADTNPMFSGSSYTVAEGAAGVATAEPGSVTLGITMERPPFPDPLLSFLSVPPLWLEPIEAAQGQGKKGAGKGNSGAADAARALANGALVQAATGVAGGLAELKKLTGPKGSGFGCLSQPEPISSVEVTTAQAAASVGILPRAFTFSVSRPLPPPLSSLATPLGDSWHGSGPGRGQGAEVTVGNAGEVECTLEEEPLAHRLRSLPLLSEVLYSVSQLGPEAAMAWAQQASTGKGARAALLALKRSRRDRSLGVLTQRFLKLFLLDRKVVTLDFAAPVVIPEDDTDEEGEEDGAEEQDGKGRRAAAGAGRKDASAAPSSSSSAAAKSAPSGPVTSVEGMSEANKLKVRRLYDIANVLCALRLIDRVYIKGRGQKKPAFRWRGPAYVEPVAGVPLPDWALLKVPPPVDVISKEPAVHMTALDRASSASAGAGAGSGAGASSVPSRSLAIADGSAGAGWGSGSASGAAAAPGSDSDLAPSAAAPAKAGKPKGRPRKSRVDHVQDGSGSATGAAGASASAGDFGLVLGASSATSSSGLPLPSDLAAHGGRSRRDAAAVTAALGIGLELPGQGAGQPSSSLSPPASQAYSNPAFSGLPTSLGPGISMPTLLPVPTPVLKVGGDTPPNSTMAFPQSAPQQRRNRALQPPGTFGFGMGLGSGLGLGMGINTGYTGYGGGPSYGMSAGLGLGLGYTPGPDMGMQADSPVGPPFPGAGQPSYHGQSSYGYAAPPAPTGGLYARSAPAPAPMGYAPQPHRHGGSADYGSSSAGAGASAMEPQGPLYGSGAHSTYPAPQAVSYDSHQALGLPPVPGSAAPPVAGYAVGLPALGGQGAVYAPIVQYGYVVAPMSVAVAAQPVASYGQHAGDGHRAGASQSVPSHEEHAGASQDGARPASRASKRSAGEASQGEDEEDGAGLMEEGAPSDGLGRPRAGKRRRRVAPGDLADLPRPASEFMELGMSASQLAQQTAGGVYGGMYGAGARTSSPGELAPGMAGSSGRGVAMAGLPVPTPSHATPAPSLSASYIAHTHSGAGLLRSGGPASASGSAGPMVGSGYSGLPLPQLARLGASGGSTQATGGPSYYSPALRDASSSASGSGVASGVAGARAEAGGPSSSSSADVAMDGDPSGAGNTSQATGAMEAGNTPAPAPTAASVSSAGSSSHGRAHVSMEMEASLLLGQSAVIDTTHGSAASGAAGHGATPASGYPAGLPLGESALGHSALGLAASGWSSKAAPGPVDKGTGMPSVLPQLSSLPMLQLNVVGLAAIKGLGPLPNMGLPGALPNLGGLPLKLPPLQLGQLVGLQLPASQGQAQGQGLRLEDL